MNEHGLPNLAPLAIMAFFVITAMWRRFSAGSKRAAAELAAARPPVIPKPAMAVEPLARRRLSPPQTTRPAVPAARPQTLREAITPSMAQTLPAEAAAAFPGLDLSLPDAGGSGAAFTAKRRRIRTFGGGPAIGSPAWAANAIVANEILGPPVSLRSGATLGAPHAF
jgi:hypothetical protein